MLIVCSSYNGLPPENAVQFVKWISNGDLTDALAGVSYTVFGCGDTDWAATYQAVSTLIDIRLGAHGANWIRDRGPATRTPISTASIGFDSQYRVWHADLWSAVAATLGIETVQLQPAAIGSRLSITMVNRQLTNPVVQSCEATPARVTENRELSAIGPVPSGVRSTRHIEVALPDDLEYRAGDHLGVLPRNSPGAPGRLAGMWFALGERNACEGRRGETVQPPPQGVKQHRAKSRPACRWTAPIRQQ